MSDLLTAATLIAHVITDQRDLAVLERHGYINLAQVSESDRAHFEEWGISEVDLLIAAADEARVPKGVG